MKTILAKIDGSSNDAAVLESSYLVASQFISHIACLYVRADSVRLMMNAADGIGLAAGVVPVTPEVQQALLEADNARARSARQSFDMLCKRPRMRVAELASAAREVSASWLEVQGDPSDATATIGRFYDLVVLARSQTSSDLYADDIGSILMGCGRPVLIAVSPPPKAIGSTIAIAWKETAEAARAVTAASPLLAQAAKVIVLSSQEGEGNETAVKRSGENLADHLRWQGLQVDVQTIADAGRTTAQAIVAAARQADADLLVMGAYGHSRARELIFGGVTRHVLNGAGIPVLLSH